MLGMCRATACCPGLVAGSCSLCWASLVSDAAGLSKAGGGSDKGCGGSLDPNALSVKSLAWWVTPETADQP